VKTVIGEDHRGVGAQQRHTVSETMKRAFERIARAATAARHDTRLL